ncbi:hypothetical protein AHF37_01957 [Paragonimus kellicotti]|nr:hypothetical protein AHF37_01957 [Paragonimus kellicotti]
MHALVHSLPGTNSTLPDTVEVLQPIPSSTPSMFGPPLALITSRTFSGCELPVSYFPQSHRPHPYSWIKRSSSALSQRHPSSTGRSGTESISAHVNNHSNTDNEFRGFRNENAASDKRVSRSSSVDSNSHPSLASSLNNTVASDLWQNEACITSCTLSAHADLERDQVERADSIESSVLKSGCVEVDDSISETTSPQESNNGKRSKLVSHGDLDCPTGDHHPPVSSHLGPACSPVSLRSQTRLFYPHVPLTPFTVRFPTQQSSRSSTRSDGPTSGEILDSQTSAACHDDRGANKSPHQPPTQQSQQPQTVTSLQHLPVDQNQQPHAVAANQLTSPLLMQAGRGLRILPNGPFVSPGVPLSFTQTNSAMPFATTSLPPSTCLIPSSLYMDTLTLTIWQFYTSTRQSKVKYAKKVHLRNALHMVVSGVFENAGLFIVGSSMNGFGSDQSDMDMCLTVTSRDLQQKKEAFVVLSQLLPPLRKCSFIRNLHLIRAKVPILKFRDTLAGVDCDLNVNNVVGIYNTHLLAMYTKIDWRVRPLGMFVKYWAQRMDIHDGSRGRLSTYPLLLMLIHYLQAACSPPVLPNLQAKFPVSFNRILSAKVPILKFRDTLAGVDCDLNVNNVVGIYNTHLLAMYTKIDWRVRPLGMFVKYWAQRMDIHDGSRGRLSTYPLLLMLIHYLQAACSPPVLPNLQAKFPKIFNYARPLNELDMRLELPWAELRSNNPASLAELFVGFIHYYTNEFDFTRWAVSVRHGAPLPIDMAIRRLPPHEQAHTARSFKVFVEEPFCQSNAARSLYDDNVLNRIRQAFLKTHQTLRSQRPLESIWVNP